LSAFRWRKAGAHSALNFGATFEIKAERLLRVETSTSWGITESRRSPNDDVTCGITHAGFALLPLLNICCHAQSSVKCSCPRAAVERRIAPLEQGAESKANVSNHEVATPHVTRRCKRHLRVAKLAAFQRVRSGRLRASLVMMSV
jgi:hypothetical protein